MLPPERFTEREPTPREMLAAAEQLQVARSAEEIRRVILAMCGETLGRINLALRRKDPSVLPTQQRLARLRTVTEEDIGMLSALIEMFQEAARRICAGETLDDLPMLAARLPEHPHESPDECLPATMGAVYRALEQCRTMGGEDREGHDFRIFTQARLNLGNALYRTCAFREKNRTWEEEPTPAEWRDDLTIVWRFLHPQHLPAAAAA